MLWRHPVTANQLEWDTLGIRRATLSVWEKGKWVPVVKVTGYNGKTSFPARSSARWRLDIGQFNEKPMIFELKLSGPPQYRCLRKFTAPPSAT